MILDCLLDAAIDTIKILPFLLATYLVLEYIEHVTGEGLINAIRNSGVFGPVVGGILGAVPQCGVSSAASNFYAGRIISLGTLIAIYLSTSDEMLPIMLSSNTPKGVIAKVLILKIVLGCMMGILVDLVFRKSDFGKSMHFAESDNHMHDDCEEDESFVVSALKHTVNVAFFIFAVSLVLNILIEMIGQENISSFVFNAPIIGNLLAGLVGLIPNCAASVVITNLYLRKAITFGSMMSGLFAGAGIGLLVLFRLNRNEVENVKIVGLLYLISVLLGIAIDILKIA